MKKLIISLLLSLSLVSPAFAGLKAVTSGVGDASNMTVTPTGGTSDSLGDILGLLYFSGPPYFIDTVSSSSYSILSSDAGRLKVLTNSGDMNLSISSASSDGFTSGFSVLVQNNSILGIATVTPTTSLIGGKSTLKLAPGQIARITSNGTDYIVSDSTTIGGVNYSYAETSFGGTMGLGIGAASGLLATGTAGNYQSTAIGYKALSSTVIGSPFGNTAVGYQSMTNNLSGDFNTSVGSLALGTSTGGTQNTAIGYQALRQGGAPSYNTAVGYQSLYSVTSQTNVGVGKEAGRNVTSGGSQTAIGQKALAGFSATPITGSNNTAVGNQSLLSGMGAVARNTAVGADSGATITTGTNNTVIGYAVGSRILTTGSNNILIGTSSLIDATSSGDSNILVIGGGSTPVISATAINTATPIVSVSGTLSVLTGGLTNRAICWKSGTTLGYCSSVVAADGSCTCN